MRAQGLQLRLKLEDFWVWVFEVALLTTITDNGTAKSLIVDAPARHYTEMMNTTGTARTFCWYF